MTRVSGCTIDGSLGQVRMDTPFHMIWAMELIVLCSGRNKDLLLREVAAIQELLQEQPDSRCESSFLLPVHYFLIWDVP
jgi:hypothetical protein